MKVGSVKLGLVVGKFYPPHRGHKYLIETARGQVDRLVVLVAHHASQTIPGELRRRWLEAIHPDCEIHVVPDELDNDSAQWAKFTLAYLGRAPDVVFTSEDYGAAFARHMGCRHVMVDRARKAVPVSGTAVRADPLSQLTYLEPCVRAHFVRRVVLIGAESTGKTTLAEWLAHELNTTWVAEYGRAYWEQKVAGLKMDGPLPGWTSDEFLHIATEQQRRENLAAGEANKVLICDTNAFATGTWHERYLSSRDARVDAVGERDRVDLYLLAAPDFPFVQDGWRDGESIRSWMHQRFLTQLRARERERPFVLLEGAESARRVQALAAVTTLVQPPRFTERKE